VSASDRIVTRVMRVVLPLRFDPAQARDLAATFELRVRRLPRRRPVPLTVRITTGHCDVLAGPAPDAGATATLGIGDMVALALGRAGWPQLMSAGRLELSGDPFLALRFPILFRLPAGANR
jgi:hypothetical protein